MTTPSLDEFNAKMDRDGWIVIPDVVSMNLVERMRVDIEAAYATCREVQIRNGVYAETDRTVHHAIGLGDSFLDYLQDLPLLPFYESYFQGKFILNSFGGAINTRNTFTYAHRIHRDIRSFSGDLPLLLNTLIMLDDFTPDNGATHMMTGSHVTADKPADSVFYARSEQALGSVGSLLMFNSNLWHAGGENRTDRPRRSMTPLYSKPFVKQGFDYPRSLGYDREGLSDTARQILGYNARVPASLEEWYQPPDKRMYRPGQG
jgi:ectoine hydroxylase-related dioxygenase (phytanoyl-CoA dioxygenase family)